MENSFLLSWKIHQGLGWLERPIVIAIALMVLLTIGMPIFKKYRKKRKAVNEPAVKLAKDADKIIDEDKTDPAMSLFVGLLLLGVFIATMIPTLEWPVFVRAFPLIAIVPGMIMVIFTVIGELRLKSGETQSSWASLIQASFSADTNRKAASFFAYLIGAIILSLLIGQKLALPMFVFFYLTRWGKYSKAQAGLYSFGCWVLLIGFYDRVVSLFWHKSLLKQELAPILPDWIPQFLFL